MGVDWLQNSVRTIASAALMVAVVECFVGEERRQGGLRLVCGAVIAAAIIRMIAECANAFF